MLSLHTTLAPGNIIFYPFFCWQKVAYGDIVGRLINMGNLTFDGLKSNPWRSSLACKVEARLASLTEHRTNLLRHKGRHEDRHKDKHRGKGEAWALGKEERLAHPWPLQSCPATPLVRVV